MTQVDTFIIRVRREGAGEEAVERWLIEHVQSGDKTHVHDLEEATSVIRQLLSATRTGNQTG